MTDLRDDVQHHAQQAAHLADLADEAIDDNQVERARTLAIIAQAHALAAEALTTAYHFGEQDIFL